MKRIIAIIIALFTIACTLTSCTSKYEFQYAFFPIEIEDGEPIDNNYNSFEIEEKYTNTVNEYLDSLTSFINNKFNLNISKPMPYVKGYIPTKDSLASYLNGTLYIDTAGITDDEIYGIIHELIHYLSDNNGVIGFLHQTVHHGISTTVGFGLTEGMTDAITIMYCNENNIPLPQRIIDATDYYLYNRNLAELYYTLEPKAAEWLFKNDYESMSNFVKSSIQKVANVPLEYSNTDVFDFHFYTYQDILMSTVTGEIQDDYSFQLMFTASFEIAAITTRSAPSKEIQKQIYENILKTHDQYDVVKNMIFS